MKLQDAFKETHFYKMFSKQQQKINEGLITSWPIETMAKKLNTKNIPFEVKRNPTYPRLIGNLELGIDIDVLLGFIAIANSKQEYLDIKQLCTQAGYYPASIGFLIKKRSKYIETDSEKFSAGMESGIIGWLEQDKFNCVSISAEAKFDYEIEVSTLQGNKTNLFHVTPAVYSKKIEKIGFSPRHGDRLGHHPDRVYFSIKKDAADAIAPQLQATGIHADMVMIEVDINKISPNTKFYLDQNFAPFGIYTLNNISPRAIKSITPV
jgi:hypothetical protein